MNSPLLLIVSGCLFVLAYRYYSAFIAAKVLMLNDTYVTPAYRCNDGREFVPTNKWVLFGHHFAAIAGAGRCRGGCCPTVHLVPSATVHCRRQSGVSRACRHSCRNRIRRCGSGFGRGICVRPVVLRLELLQHPRSLD